MESQSWETDADIKAELEAMAGAATVVESKKSDSVKRKTKKHKSKIATKKPSKAKEKPPASTMASSEQIDFINLLKQPAFTAEEKYKVLEARDKLIRLRTKRNTDITSAKHIIGTCPDMCPEKERLMREVQHQVSLYEQEPGEKTMNPSLAVKQYSRSSADQEVPLPHELRPVSVLQRTMSYLLHKIVDLCDNADINIAEWYHFLWDRTRGIRKDITQQELCCKGAVELVEQCARFHIHCSARLVAEDPSVFDQKINTENLTKCLQTLKYMYHDLEVKNESCPNEAEFRAYVILLNLNDGNFMWEVQQLREEIQKSREIKFALSAYSALDKKNYVRFFNLVRSTTYLNACILLRYFVQIRLMALKTILKSYSPRVPHTQFPLEELQRILAFEDSATTADFVEYHGLYLNESKTHIIVDRKTFQMPEFSYTLDRATSIIEAKRQGSVGEIICGRRLERIDFARYTPHNSFDSNGLINISDYLPDIDLSILQKDKSESKESFSEEKSSDAFSKSQKSQESIFHPNIFALKSSSESRSNSPMDTVDRGQDVKEFWSKSEKNTSIFGGSGTSIFGAAKSEKTASPPVVFGGTIGATPTVFGANTPQTGSIFGKPQTDIPPQQTSAPTLFTQRPPESTASSNVVKPLFAASNVVKPVFTAAFTAPKADPSTSTPAAPKSANFTQGGFRFNLKPTQATPPQIKPAENQDLLKQQKEKAIQMQRELEEKIKLENEKKLRLDEEKRIKTEKAEALKKKMEAERKREQEALMRRRLEERMLRKRTEEERKRLEEAEERKMREIRSTVSEVLEDLKAEVESKVREDKLREISRRVELRKSRCYFAKWRRSVLLNKRKRKAIDQWPIWANSTTLSEEAAELRVRSQGETLKYMKRYKSGSAIDLQPIGEMKIEPIDLERLTRLWLAGNFGDSHRISRERFLKIDVFIASSAYLSTNLTWIEDVVNDLFSWKENDYELVQETRVSTYTVRYCIKRKESYKHATTDGYIFIGDDLSEEFYADIEKIVSGAREHSNVPIAVLLQNDDYDDDLLNSLVSEKKISQYKVVVRRYSPKRLGSYIENALLYIGENIPADPPLELDTLKAFLYKHLATELWERMSSFAKWNRPYRKCLTRPEILINLYNEALANLENIIFDVDNLEYRDFPEVFRTYLDQTSAPVLPCDFKHFPGFWRNASYAGKVKRTLALLTLPPFKTKWPPKDVDDLQRTISEFCHRFFRDPSKKAYRIVASILRFFDPSRDFAEIENVLWSEVIKVLVSEKLEELDFSLREPFTSVFDELFVVYNRNTLKEYNESTWFYLTNPVIQKELNTEEFKSFEDAEEEVMESEGAAEVIDIDLEAALAEVRRERYDREERLSDSKRDLREFEMLMADLEESMSITKQISKRFEEMLVKAINE